VTWHHSSRYRAFILEPQRHADQVLVQRIRLRRANQRASRERHSHDSQVRCCSFAVLPIFLMLIRRLFQARAYRGGFQTGEQVACSQRHRRSPTLSPQLSQISLRRTVLSVSINERAAVEIIKEISKLARRGLAIWTISLVSVRRTAREFGKVCDEIIKWKLSLCTLRASHIFAII